MCGINTMFMLFAAHKQSILLSQITELTQVQGPIILSGAKLQAR